MDTASRPLQALGHPAATRGPLPNDLIPGEELEAAAQSRDEKRDLHNSLAKRKAPYPLLTFVPLDSSPRAVPVAADPARVRPVAVQPEIREAIAGKDATLLERASHSYARRAFAPPVLCLQPAKHQTAR
jgi:hypothetical protein